MCLSMLVHEYVLAGVDSTQTGIVGVAKLTKAAAKDAEGGVCSSLAACMARDKRKTSLTLGSFTVSC